MQSQKKLLVTSILALAVTQAGAANYSIDFSVFSSPGGNWNSVFGSTNATIDLVEFDSGLETGATMTTLGLGGDSNITNGWTAGNISWLDATAAADGAYTGVSASITISNLPAGTYRVFLVAAEGTSPSNFPTTADFTVNSAFADTNRLATSANGNNWNTDTDGVNNWMEWSSVTSTDDLTLEIDASADGYTTINALRIETLTTIPEPSTNILFGIAGAFLIARRKRL